ncbi:hypothetical protein B4N89_41250 [Embleya scabrispora]|uniref:Uncharacterized protein n=1 Tax=Embleya scabrispora TaxID=159449 RepID=A0A1T3NK57_9ACTN|nr:hypothetical protein B4N89_41250 [Embleya scabrispora]
MPRPRRRRARIRPRDAGGPRPGRGTRPGHRAESPHGRPGNRTRHENPRHPRERLNARASIVAVTVLAHDPAVGDTVSDLPTDAVGHALRPRSPSARNTERAPTVGVPPQPGRRAGLR